MRQQHGKAWQGALDATHLRYRRERLAVIHRTEAPFVVERALEGGRMVGHFAAEGPPDYNGTISAGPHRGRGVSFEAKSTRQQWFHFGAIARHQAAALTATQDGGGVSGVAVRQGRRAWWLPWALLSEPWWLWYETPKPRRGVTSKLSPDDMDDLGNQIPITGDWLPLYLEGPYG